ncbi:hypothetical protein [Bartonella sp. HY406]|uniref:hypothetical protein n=1 Tax=Bartonella sp. HY406 TaxID=2979331 RepID=UPI0021C74742|nr:hypothetical protein [Bartonella sp. HY406]UXN02836.1 hypothetical protein N6B01_10195 [Bartonella sp. HY406]
MEIKDKYLFFQYGYMVLIPILNENKDKIYFSKFSIESNDINQNIFLSFIVSKYSTSFNDKEFKDSSGKYFYLLSKITDTSINYFYDRFDFDIVNGICAHADIDD